MDSSSLSLYNFKIFSKYKFSEIFGVVIISMFFFISEYQNIYSSIFITFSDNIFFFKISDTGQKILSPSI